MSNTNQTNIPDQLSPAIVKQKLMKIGLEFLMLAGMIALVPVIVYVDVTIISEDMAEDTLTEFLHNALLFVSITAMTLGAFKSIEAKGYLLLAATFFSCLFIRENDALLDNIWHGFWKVPAIIVLTVGVALVYRNRNTLVVPMLRHFETRPATFIYIGVLLLIVFTRLFGSGDLWEGVMGSNYSYIYKRAIQEGLELLSYMLIAYGSVISYFGQFGLDYSPK